MLTILGSASTEYSIHSTFVNAIDFNTIGGDFIKYQCWKLTNRTFLTVSKNLKEKGAINANEHSACWIDCSIQELFSEDSSLDRKLCKKTSGVRKPASSHWLGAQQSYKLLVQSVKIPPFQRMASTLLIYHSSGILVGCHQLPNSWVQAVLHTWLEVCTAHCSMCISLSVAITHQKKKTFKLYNHCLPPVLLVATTRENWKYDIP